MYVIGVVGDRGAGKTCFMTRQLYKDYQEGRKIITNYRVKFSATYMSFGQIAELPEELNNATIAMDELGVGADSRSFFSGKNKSLTKLITQIRKRNCILYFTVQRMNLIDKRIREQTDRLFILDRLDNNGRFILSYIDAVTGDDLAEDKIFDGRPYFDLYDTNEIIDFEEGE